MSEANTGPEFLQQKYQLNKDPGVTVAARRHEQRTGEVVDQGDFSTRIQNYLNRLDAIINPPKLESRDDFDRKERNLSIIKQSLYRNFVTTPEDIPESYYDSIKRRHKEEGHGDIEIPDDYRQEFAQTIIEDQKRSLDLWVDYLASGDAKYPDWLKYFAFRSVLRMGNYDKSKEVFNERTKGKKTTAPFPELNREALAIVLGDLEKKYSDEKAKPNGSRADFEFTGRYDISAEVKQKYLKALENKNFSQLYALAIEEFKPIAEELLKNTEGKWVKYLKESDPKQLVSSIANYGTGWCLRGEAMAQRYLVRDKNDLHIYYSKDQEGKPVVPRVVIVINQSGNITEVRGVATQENLDSYIGNVVDAKLSEPEFEKEGRAFKKKSADMRTLTVIDGKVKSGQELTGGDLTFLYEIDSPVEGFGYNRDPRIAELRSQRNLAEDMPIVFGCERNQIVHTIREIRSDTKAYVGPLEPDIFDKLQDQNIEHVYTSFPEGKIRIEDLAIGGRPKKQLREDLRHGNIQVSPYVEDQIKHPDFTTLPTSEVIKTVRLRVRDLGFKNGATTADIIGTENDVDEYGKPAPFTKGRMTQLGLALCLPEVGIYQRLKDANQPLGNWYYIAMKPIPDRGGYPDVFILGRYEDGTWLDRPWARPGHGWDPEAQFVFGLRKSETQNPGLFDRIFKR